MLINTVCTMGEASPAFRKRYKWGQKNFCHEPNMIPPRDQAHHKEMGKAHGSRGRWELWALLSKLMT